MAGPPKRAFVALEGGGAKGVVHVGALAALEERGYEIVGVAGTSAGAIVAALTAAGITPEEIIDPLSDRTVIQRVPGARTALDLLSVRGWARLHQLRAIINSRLRQIALLSILALLLAAPIGVQAAAGGWAGLAALTVICLAFVFCGRAVLTGLTNLTRFRNAVGVILAQQILPEDQQREPLAPETVKFRDFGPGAGRPTLKIIATNQSRGELQLFSPELTPDVPVADAVAASGCIPVAFKPWRIRNGLPDKRRDLFFDGGLLSNLPTWAFNDERALDRDAWSIAMEILPDGAPDAKPRRGFFADVGKLVRTTIFGAQSLTRSRTGKPIDIGLRTSIGVFDMDMTAEEVRIAVSNAKASAEWILEREEALAAIPDQVLGIARQIFRDVGYSEIETIHLRSTLTPVPESMFAVAQRSAGAEIALQLRHHAGFEDSPDEFLNVPLPRSFIGAAIRSKAMNEGVFFDLTSPENEHFDFSSDVDRWTRKFRSPTLKWVVVVPISIFNPRKRKMEYLVLTLDSDKAPPQHSSDFSAFKRGLQGIEVGVLQIFQSLPKDAGS